MASSPFCGGNYLHSHFNHSLQWGHTKHFYFFHPIEDRCEWWKRRGWERELKWDLFLSETSLFIQNDYWNLFSLANTIKLFQYKATRINIPKMKKKHKAYTTRSVTIAIISRAYLIWDEFKKKRKPKTISVVITHIFLFNVFIIVTLVTSTNY